MHTKGGQTKTIPGSRLDHIDINTGRFNHVIFVFRISDAKLKNTKAFRKSITSSYKKVIELAKK